MFVNLIRRSPRSAAAILLLGLVLAGVSIFAYRWEAAAREKQALAALQAVADLKADAINRSLTEQRNRADALDRSPLFADFLSRGGDDATQRARILDFMKHTRDRAQLDNVFLFDESGTPVAAAQTGRSDEAQSTAAAKQAMATGSPVFIDLYNDTSDKTVDLGFAEPIYARGETTPSLLGAVVIDFPALSIIGRNFAVWPLANASAQVRMIRRDGDNALFFGDYGENDQDIEIRRVPIHPGGITERIFAGAIGPFEGDDRTGRTLLAARAAIPGTDWSVFVAVGRNETVAPALQFAIIAGIFGFALLLVAIISAFFVAQRRRLKAALDEMDRARIVQAAETQFRIIFEQATAGIALISPTGKFMRVNRRFCDLFGYSEAEMLAQNVLELVQSDERDSTETLVALLKSGELDEFVEEKSYHRADSSTLWAETRVHIVRKSDGAPEYFIAILEDTTERKRADQMLRESEERFRKVVEGAPNAMVMADTHGIIEMANRQAEIVFARRASELLGQPIDLFVPERFRKAHGGDRSAFMTYPERRVMGGGGEIFAQRKDGSEVPVEVGLTPIETESGTKVLATIVDITERKNQSDALRKSEEQLHHAQKMEAIGNLTGGMAHDFNNILGVIVANLDLARPMVECADASAMIDEAIAAALLGADLTRRLLAFARRQPLRPEPIDLNKLVTTVTALLRRTIGEDVVISVDLAPDIWSVVVDPSQLEAALINLANNARDAMPAGGSLTIATFNQALDASYCAENPEALPGDYVMIEVRDTGTGMRPEVVKQIFEPFFTTKEPGKGTGLGLSMVFGFVKQSGGHIGVASEPGVGTSFRLYLPRAVEVEEALPAQGVRSATSTGGGEKVLVVEDNEALRLIAVRQLVALGYHVIAASDAAGALRVLEHEHVDILFSDIVMPGRMNGIALANEALARWPALGVVLTSGFNDSGENWVPVGLAKAVKILAKPYRKNALGKVLREALATAAEEVM